MRVAVKEPFKPAYPMEIAGDLDSMQQVVAFGDHRSLEVAQDGPTGLDLWVNEEGKYASRMEPEQDDPNLARQVYAEANLKIFDGADFVMGTAFVAASTPAGRSVGLTDEQLRQALAWLDSRAVSVIDAARARARAALLR